MMPYVVDKFIKFVYDLLATKLEDFGRVAIRASSFIVFYLHYSKLELFPGCRNV